MRRPAILAAGPREVNALDRVFFGRVPRQVATPGAKSCPYSLAPSRTEAAVAGVVSAAGAIHLFGAATVPRTDSRRERAMNSRHRSLVSLAGVLALVFAGLLPAAARAQVVGGSIGGTITDDTGRTN